MNDDTKTSNETAPASLSSRIRGLSAHEMDIQLAKMAADVYLDSSSVVDGWRPLNTQELAAAGIDGGLLVNDRSGFAARIYADDRGGYVLAFRGSNEGKDWIHNIGQGLGFEDAQYAAAERLARKAHGAFGDNLVITGHSLGGGLATLGSVATGSPSVTFNSAGLSDATLRRLQRDPDAVHQLAEEGLIRRYSVDHEILTTLQEKNIFTRGLLPDAIGHKIDLPDPHPVHGWKKLVPGSSLKHGLDLHGMDSVMEAQQLAARGSVADAAHPANGMFNQALDGLRGLKPNTLGFNSETEYRNAAGSLVAKAHGAGMQRIDHVVIGANGALFAVEGPLQDASHRITSVEKTLAAAQPIETSSNQVRQQMEAGAPLPQPAETQRRTALTP